MAYKFVLLSALLAVTSAGYVSPPTYTTYAAAPTVVTKVVRPAHDAVASTHQNVVRSFGGTVSQYSKAIDTPYSSVRKQDTRITNDVYTPAITKTLHYAAPAPTAAVYTHQPITQTVYTHAGEQEQQQHQVHYQHQPSSLYTHAVPTKTVSYAAPATQVYQHTAPAPQVYHPVEQPQHVYQHSAPAAVHTATTSYNHGPAATTYTHNAPGVAAYGSSQTVHYSPAEMVSHMSFDGFGTHWGY